MNRSIVAAVGIALGLMAQLAAAADWPMFQDNGSNSGTSPLAAPVHNLSQQWSTDLYTTYGLKFQPGEAPVISNGSLYAYALGDTGEAHLVALNASTGAVTWLSDRLQDEGGYGSHNGASVDPLTGDVYIASWNSMYRINSTTGHITWQYTAPSSVWGGNAVINGAPAVAAGKAFWQTAGGDGHLIGINTNSAGTVTSPAMNVTMSSAVGGSSVGTPVTFSNGGQTYITMNYGRGYGYPMGGGLEVINANTGAVVWSKSEADLPTGATTNDKAAYCFNSSVSYKDGVIYARSYDDRMGQTFNGTLYAIDAISGNVIWKTQNQVPGGTNDNVVNGHGAPIVDDKYVYVSGGTSLYGGIGQKVQAFSRTTGQLAWETADIGGWANQMATADGFLYVGTEAYSDYYQDDQGNWLSRAGGADKLTVLSAATGRIVSQYIGAGSSPALANGLIYTVDGQGDMVAIKGSMPGDVNNDGKVDQSDFKLWYDNYGKGTAWETGDLDGNGVVDQADYKLWYDNYGVQTTPGTVPEPASLALCVLGAAAMLRRRK